ncbi:hypothetical protein CNR37_00081 [Pseudomonas phage ventosus]|uniref:Uncharacterized protein n=1 Tax=Pseudomonas phage ventosus TaxID=2048980 RepID=A0A2H4P7Z8_9CAUD|nr:hypothetical protein CNR37_00081 [Pseudomonas phage ventosus]
MVAEMANGKLAYVPVDAVVGQEIEIWCVRSGRLWKSTIVKLV